MAERVPAEKFLNARYEVRVMRMRLARLQDLLTIAALIGAMTVGAPLLAEGSQGALPDTSAGEFFIISSVDAKKHEIVLKKPTEVTELVRVADKTIYLNEEGKPISFQDLRAGDTVFVTVRSEREGLPVVVRIRKGPMTLEELHRRYLKY
jgi:hypothetical protein